MIQTYLPYLHYFWLVAQHLSFTKAAKSLRISQSAVSIQIKNLEEKLGVQLFIRTAKNKVALSSQGVKLAEYCQRIFPELDRGLSELTSPEIQGRFVVTAAVNFGSIVLAPMLKILQKKYPRLEVEIRPTDTVVDLSRENVDLAIRWGSTKDPKLTYEYILHELFILVASRDYLKSHPSIQKTKDLEKHTAIIRRQDNPDWRHWSITLPRCKTPSLYKTILIESTYGMIEATKTGLGVCVLPVYAIFDDLKSGRLKPILLKYQKRITEPFYACYPRSPYPLPKVVAFLQTLREYLKTRYGDKAFVSLP